MMREEPLSPAARRATRRERSGCSHADRHTSWTRCSGPEGGRLGRLQDLGAGHGRRSPPVRRARAVDRRPARSLHACCPCWVGLTREPAGAGAALEDAASEMSREDAGWKRPGNRWPQRTSPPASWERRARRGDSFAPLQPLATDGLGGLVPGGSRGGCGPTGQQAQAAGQGRGPRKPVGQEIEVLALVAEGPPASNRRGPRAGPRHRHAAVTNIFAKLGVKSRAAAVASAVPRGLLPRNATARDAPASPRDRRGGEGWQGLVMKGRHRTRLASAS